MEIALLSAVFFVLALSAIFIAVFVGLKITDRNRGITEPELQIFKDEEVSSISPWAALLSKFDIFDVIRTRTQQAGLDWSAGRTSAAMLLVGAISLVILRTLDWIPLVVAILFSIAFASLPYAYILRRRKQRIEAFEAQFPDALEAIIRGLRAGHPFAASMEMVADEEMGPVTQELRHTIEEWKLGMTWNQALENLANRVPSMEVGIFVAAVKLQMRTGGRLGEVLLKLAESMRENVAMRGEVRALAAQGRATGTVLTFMPIGLGILLYFINPAQMAILFQDPGRTLVLICVGLLIVGHFVIRQIVDIRM